MTLNQSHTWTTKLLQCECEKCAVCHQRMLESINTQPRSSVGNVRAELSNLRGRLPARVLQFLHQFTKHQWTQYSKKQTTIDLLMHFQFKVLCRPCVGNGFIDKFPNSRWRLPFIRAYYQMPKSVKARHYYRRGCFVVDVCLLRILWILMLKLSNTTGGTSQATTGENGCSAPYFIRNLG